MKTHATCCLLTFGVVTVLVGPGAAVDAQSLPSTDALYSRGVHSYFSGCSACAEEALTLAISLAPDDPRPYYFRALSRLRMGQEFAAREDMQLGAALEAESPGQYAVGRALERVQGGHRLLLERYRHSARVAHSLQRGMVERAQREQLLERNEAVERRRVAVPLEMLKGDVEVDAFAPETEPQPPQPIELPPEETRKVEAAATDETPEAESEEEIDPFSDDPVDEGAEGAPLLDEPAPEEVESERPGPVDGDVFDDELPADEENPFESLDF